jgi:hypothetical protein
MMKKRVIIVAIPLLLILGLIVSLVWLHSTPDSSATKVSPKHPLSTELKAAQSSVETTIEREKDRIPLIGETMYHYIVSQKQGLISALPDQLKTYSYEDEEATNSNTIVVTYHYRDELDPSTLTSAAVAGYQANYTQEIQSILQAMKSAGIQNPHVRSIYYDEDGQYLYALHAEMN